MRVTRFASGLVTLTALILALGARPAPAADAPPVAMATLAAKSLDSAAALAKEVGIDLPPFLTAPGIEEQFAFIGKGGMATDKPIGIIFFGAPGASPEQLITFVLPVKAGAATLDSLKAMGAVPIPGHDDTVVLNQQLGLRRSGDYLIFSPGASAVTAVNLAAFSNMVKGADALAKLSIDLKALRNTNPEMVRTFLGNIEKEANKNATDDAYRLGSGLVTNSFRQFVETVDRVDVALQASAQTLRLLVSVSPAKVPPVAGANRPGLPAGVVARLDLGVSIHQAFPSSKDLIAKFEQILEKENKKENNDAQMKAIRDLMNRAGTLVMDASATSVGAEIVNGQPRAYIVQHWANQIDVPAEIRQIVSSINTLAEKDKADEHLAVQSYDLDGNKVLRVTANEKGKPIGAMDVVQRGNDVYYLISNSLEHHIGTLLSAPAEGAIKDPFSGVIHLGTLFDQISAMPGSPAADLPPDTKKQLAEMLHGRKITLSLSGQNEGATISISLDRALLHDVGTFLKKSGE